MTRSEGHDAAGTGENSFPSSSAASPALAPDSTTVIITVSSAGENGGSMPFRVEPKAEKGVDAPEKRVCVVVGDGRDSETEEEKICRICHLSPENDGSEGSELKQIGCGCKGELGIAHRHCAEAWFRVKGNRTCEICGLYAKSITGEEDLSFMEEWQEGRTMGIRNSNSSSERVSCWRSQPFCNFLMACLIVAFIFPWFFRVNVF